MNILLITKRIFLTLLILMLAVLMVLYCLISTETGSRLLTRQLISHLPGNLYIHKISGTFTKNYHLENLSYANANNHIKLKNLTFSLQLAKLLEGKLYFKSFIANEIVVNSSSRPESADKAKPIEAYFDYFKRIQFEKLVIDQVHIISLKHTIHLTEIRTTKDNGFKARIKADGLEGQLDLTHLSPLALSWTLHIPDLSSMNANWKGILDSQGRLQAIGQFYAIDATVNGRKLVLNNYAIDELNSKIETAGNEIKAVILANNFTSDAPFKTVSIRTRSLIEKEVVRSKLYITINKATVAEGNLTLAKRLQPTDNIKGSFNFNLNSLTNLNFQGVKFTQPDIKGQINVAGTLASPSLQGTSQMNLAALTIEKTGTYLENIHLILNCETLKRATLQGNFKIGNGQGKLNGQINLNNDERSLSLTLSGENLHAIKQPEYNVILSPNLTLRYANDVYQINGKIHIDEATLSPHHVATSVKPSNDIEYIDDEDEKKNDYLKQLAMNVVVDLSQNVRISYDKLKTKLTGHLTIQKLVNGSTTGTGELTTKNGKYNAYNNELNIENGRLVYTGNLITDPGLDIRAVKKIQTVSMNKSKNLINDSQLGESYGGMNDLRVGVWISGSIHAPRIKLMSEPEGLDQADILSYLLFGYAKDKITSTSSLTLLNNVLSSGNQSMDFTKKIQKALSLSELNVGQTEFYDPTTNGTSRATTLSLGKKLGKNLYLKYTVGLFEPISILNLRYQINRHFAIQSETSTLDSGVDLLYEIETD